MLNFTEELLKVMEWQPNEMFEMFLIEKYYWMLWNILRVSDFLIADGETMTKSLLEQFRFISKKVSILNMIVTTLETELLAKSKFYK